MRRVARLTLIGFLTLLLAVGASAAYLLYSPAPNVPALSASVRRGSLPVGDMPRSYLFYVPARVAPNPPLVVALHGSMSNPGQMRRATGYRFEQLADEHGFIVVYPQGYEGHWNDCRSKASYSAKRLTIDDVGFLRALVARFRATHGIDSTRVFAVGLSNGAHLAYRLALETPELVRGVAAVAANLPTLDDSDCDPVRGSVQVLIMNGTDDPINPFDGGRVTIFGFGDRGTVLSARQSAEHFAARNAIASAPLVDRLPRDESAATHAERSTWRSPAGDEVVLYSIHGAGHTFPQPAARFPRLLGKTHRALDGPAEIWRFFERAPPRA